MRSIANKAINKTATLRNWIIGRYIVEYEQHRKDRAKYGDELLKKLEKRLAQNGLTVTLLQLSRLFYHYYPQIYKLISTNY